MLIANNPRTHASSAVPGLVEKPRHRRSIKKLLMPLFIHTGTTAHNLKADSAGVWEVDWVPKGQGSSQSLHQMQPVMVS